MAIKITEDCIHCGAYEPECPNNAIYEGGAEWAIADGTAITGSFVLIDGTVIGADERLARISKDIYYITPGKCTECKGFHEEGMQLTGMQFTDTEASISLLSSLKYRSIFS